MPLIRKRGLFESNRVTFLPVEQLIPNPHQPRSRFSPDSLEELADSIRAHGILQPLSVRRTGRGYELVSGERRLRAARLAGLREVPCILVQASDVQSSLLALVENLQRQDLDFLEEAQALAQLISTFHLSQEEAAQRVGKSQSAVANKLRLLRLPQDVLDELREQGLSERHARALLRLPDDDARRQVLSYVVEHQLNVAQTEAYIEELLSPPPPPPPRKKPIVLIKDVRLFLNTVTRGLSLMRTAGVDAKCGQEETDDAILLTIRIPKAPSR
mgnify:FL=1